MVIGDEAEVPVQAKLQAHMQRTMSQPACSRSGSERALARVWSCPSISLRSCREEDPAAAGHPVKQQSLDSALKDEQEQQKQIFDTQVDYQSTA